MVAELKDYEKRKLASIQRVLNVRPIEGADKIEVADVRGWSVVVKKSEFQAGDLCVYFEIDSFIPDTHECMQSEVFKDRMITWNGKRGMRLKTIKLRKQISQGLVLSIADFPELTPSVRGIAVQEGEDVTEELGIQKWEPAEEASANGGSNGSSFPSFLRKTDQERVQNCINEFDKHKHETFEVTIKLDGSSMTVYHLSPESPYYVEKTKNASLLQRLGRWIKQTLKLANKQAREAKVGVCSRNREVEDDGNHFYNYAKQHGLFEKLKNYGMNIAVQGELVAPSIQQNHEKVAAPEFYVFDVFDINAQEYVAPIRARWIANDLGLDYIPVVSEEAAVLDYEGEPRALVEHILNMAEGSGMNPGVKREGLVFKSNHSGFSFKAVANSYLLKEKGEK